MQDGPERRRWHGVLLTVSHVRRDRRIDPHKPAILKNFEFIMVVSAAETICTTDTEPDR